MLELLAPILAGLGLFFFGIKLLAASMQRLAGVKVRRLISRATASPWRGGLIGLVGGFLLQKPSGVISILISMQASGLLGLRQAMPIIAWCNIGLALLGFFAVIPIGTVVAITLGVGGFLLMFSTRERTVTAVNALFSAALLFYGLEVMKSGSAQLMTTGWFQTMMGYAGYSPLVALVIGTAAAAVTQSYIAIAMMAIALVGTGALTAQQAMMIIYGANFGVGFFRRLYTAGLPGERQQLFLYQNIIRYIGTLGSILLFYVPMDGLPVMLYGARCLTDSVATQLALVFLACNLPAVIVAASFREPLARWIERKSPASAEDELARLRFLREADAEDRADLIEKTEQELYWRLRLLADYPSAMRPGSRPQASAESLHHSLVVIQPEITAALDSWAQGPLAAGEPGRLNRVLAIQTQVRLLDDTLFRMVVRLRDGEKVLAGVRDTIAGMVEALEAVLAVLADAVEADDEIDAAMAQAITADKGAVLECFRERTLAVTGTDAAARQIVVELINLYEESMWISHRLASIICRKITVATDD